ncbi:hypothetical protein NAD41_002380 [Salmonella enterica]|nr:hypothetical protein [Salmonella enterica]EKK6596348.1 hypothetical protein [Salmonella enterica]
MRIPKRRTDQVDEITRESRVAAKSQDTKEWLIIHSFTTDPDDQRCCVSPPMLAMKWEMAQVVFNSLLQEAVINTARQHGDAFLCKMNDEDDLFRVGIFKEYGTEVVPEEVLMLMDRSAMTDELYYEMYMREGPGEPVTREMTIVRPGAKKQVVH